MNVKARDRDLLSRTLGDVVLLLDLRTSGFVRLNGTASLLWGYLHESTSAPELVARLAAHFDVAEEAVSADVDAFLHDLAEQGLLDDA